jgi:hypothetical protein
MACLPRPPGRLGAGIGNPWSAGVAAIGNSFTLIQEFDYPKRTPLLVIRVAGDQGLFNGKMI